MSHLKPRWEKEFSNIKFKIRTSRVGFFLIIVMGIILLLSLCSCAIKEIKVLFPKEEIVMNISGEGISDKLNVGETIMISKTGTNNWVYAEPKSMFLKDTIDFGNYPVVCYRKVIVKEIYPLPKEKIAEEKNPEEKAVDPGWKVAAILLGCLFIATLGYLSFTLPASSKRSKLKQIVKINP